MQTEKDIEKRLGELKDRAPAGYALAFHVVFNAPSFLFQTYPKDWTETYSQKGYVLQDPTVAWAFSQNGRARWSELDGHADNIVMSEAAKHGLKYGVTFALDQNDSRSMASFARDDREFSDAEMDALAQTVSELHDSTAEIKATSTDLTDRLRKMSVQFARGNRS